MTWEIGDESCCAVCGEKIILCLGEEGEEWGHLRALWTFVEVTHKAIPVEQPIKKVYTYQEIIGKYFNEIEEEQSEVEL